MGAGSPGGFCSREAAFRFGTHSHPAGSHLTFHRGGGYLSQKTEGKLHPYTYFSHPLSPTEQNYNVGNSELLAIKLVLEEWQHWLEGTAQPFTVWTDHKNLAYLQSAKRLNARQARWALFITRFSFSITY